MMASESAATGVISYLFYSITQLISSTLYLVTIRIPSLVLSLLSYTGVITLEFTFAKLLFLALALFTAVSYYIKLKYLNSYTELRNVPPIDRAENFDLNPDVVASQDTPSNSGFHNYLDEFLSAIRVFGFLEKPVFHELARYLQTKRLVAGDVVDLSTEKSFYIVIDGRVEVYSQYHRDQNYSSLDEDDDVNQLLNVVESGGTLSSLFTILNLFTEDIKLRYDDPVSVDNEEEEKYPRRSSAQAKSPDVPNFNLDDPIRNRSQPFSNPSSPPRFASGFNTPYINTQENNQNLPLATNTYLQLKKDKLVDDMPMGQTSSPSQEMPGEPISDEYSTLPKENRERDRYTFASHPRENTFARASMDTTLAVIPAEAFQRLTQKFPNASAHIVQVILTRLQRVTFLAAHKYLGLTKDVLRTEQAINEMACYPLPREFYESGGMNRLRRRFPPESRSSDSSKGSLNMMASFSNSGTVPGGKEKANRMSHPFISDIDIQTKRQKRRSHSVVPESELSPTSPAMSSISPISNKTFNLSSFPSPDTKSRPGLDARPSAKRTYSFGLEEEIDFDLRQAVMDRISKSIGLAHPPSSVHSSVNISPAIDPVDSNLSHRRTFNSSFSSLSYLRAQGLEDESSTMSSFNPNQDVYLENEIEILFFQKDSTLVSAGERNRGLYFVIDGFLEVSIPTEGVNTLEKTKMAENAHSEDNVEDSNNAASGETSEPKARKAEVLFTVKPGGIAGYLSSISGFPSYVNIKAKTDAYVGFLPSKALEKIMDRKPIVLLTLAKRLISLLSPLVLHIDAALEWMQVDAGQVIYREGEASNSFYMVIQGRLRSISEKAKGSVEVLGEFGQGDSVGELDCITASRRQSTLHAIRDSELARMPMTLFNAISRRNPSITIHITRIIASRVRKEVDNELKSSSTRGIPANMGRNNFNLKTVALIPVRQSVPITEFASRLRSALEQIGAPTYYLNQAAVTTALGRHAFTRLGKLKLAGWLSEIEQKYRILLYVADTAVSSLWTQTCIRQADCIYLVAEGGFDPDLGEFERLLVGMKTTARKELVLLHPERYVLPGSTQPWLRNRPWVHAHHHVELQSENPTTTPTPFSDLGPMIAFKNLKEKVQTRLHKYRGIHTPTEGRGPAFPGNDFARLARRLCGKSVGLVLGGGGARGISHLGVIKALVEKGIPVDMIGGTSIGAFVGGLYAREGDLVSTMGRAKRFSGRLSTMWRILSDLTYPFVAYTTGHEFNRGVFKSFYDYHIEDMWINFYAVTTNITFSRKEVHTTGYAWRAIRASMSLAGLLPPLCENGNMLVDGGYCDNVPVSVMLSQGASVVVAADVGSIDDTSPKNFGDTLSGWWVLITRWNPWGQSRQVPSMAEVQSRLTYVASYKPLEEAQNTPGVLYMRLPVTQFGTMDFGRHDDIMQVGYESCKQTIKKWEKEGKIPTGMVDDLSAAVERRKRGKAIRRYSI